MPIRTSDLQKAITALRELPTKDPAVSAAKAAEELGPVVRELRARGYTSEDIAAHLARLGVSVSSHALKRAAGASRKRSRPAGAASGGTSQQQAHLPDLNSSSS